MKRAVLVGLITIGLIAATQTGGQEISAATAREVVELSGISSGVCVLLGCEDADFPVDLARSSKFRVHVLESNPKKVAEGRSAADEAGFTIQRLLIEHWSADLLPHADNTIDLVIARGTSDKPAGGVPMKEVLRVLRPGGEFIGWMLTQDSESQLRAVFPRVKQMETDVARLVAAKPPMEGVDDWSHWEHGPDNNPVSTDQVIKSPYLTQWLGQPYYIAMPAITTAAGGRTFLAMGHIAHHEREEPWLNTLLARNGYNGEELWRMKLPDGYLAHRSAFIATDDTFYMIDLDGKGCRMLDPQTGRDKGEISIPEITGEWKWIAVKDDTLFVLAGKDKDPPETTAVRSPGSHWSWSDLSRGYYAERVPWGFADQIAAFDLKKRKMLWSNSEDTGIDSRAMVLGGDRVFYYSPDACLGCLDAKSGEPVWRNTDPKVRELVEQPGQGLGSTPGFRTTCFSLYTPDALFLEAQTRMNIVAVSTEDGRFLWSRRKITNNPNMLYTDGKLHVGLGPHGSTLVVEPLTGKTIKDLNFAKRSCARLTATPDSLFCRGGKQGQNEGLTRYDRAQGKVLYNGAFRPSCNDGVIGANGLLYLGPWLCDCNLSIMGSIGLCSAGDFSFQARADAPDRLEVGEGGTDLLADLDVTAQDWATYRGNNSHSGNSVVPIDGGLVDLWTYRPEREFEPTAASAAGGLIFLGGKDGRVRVLDAVTGLLKWSYQTAGPIMQPPTIWRGRAFVGSGDGYIYALEAATGRLLWRYRAAPVERRIMAYGALCSTWPVNSGVLVEDGVAYAAAGIIDYDGTYVSAVDARTGHPKWQNSISGHLNQEVRKGVSAQGNLTISKGKLWMAGGNVVSPACYDLKSGEYVGDMPTDGSPRANRGEEIGVLGDSCVVFGGRLRYSATENVVNPGSFEIARIQDGRGLDKRKKLSSGRIPGCWDSNHVCLVNGKGSPPVCFRTSDAENYARGDTDRIPPPLWTASLGDNTDVVALALAPNAAVVAYEAKLIRTTKPPRWRVCVLDLEDGSPKWSWNLPAAPLPGGLLIDRDGRVVTVFQNGSVICFGDVSELVTQVDTFLALADKGGSSEEVAKGKLMDLLKVVHTSDARPRVVESLGRLGLNVGEEAERQGFISTWHLIGPVPWNDDNPFDKVFVNEPKVDITKPSTIGSKTISWREYLTELPSAQVDLERIYGGSPYTAMYAYAEVDLPREKNLLLKVGSDDGVLVWFNGQQVHRNDVMRGWIADQDVLPVQGRKGKNSVLLKISQGRGGWAFSARLTDRDNNPIDLRR